MGADDSPPTEAVADRPYRLGEELWRVRNDDESNEGEPDFILRARRLCGADVADAARSIGDDWRCEDDECYPTEPCEGNWCAYLVLTEGTLVSEWSGVQYGEVMSLRIDARLAAGLRDRTPCGAETRLTRDDFERPSEGE